MSAVLDASSAAAWPDRSDAEEPFGSNRAWELDRILLLERSERRAWYAAIAALVLGLIGLAAAFAQGPLRAVVEGRIVLVRVTGAARIQQPPPIETIRPLEAVGKHNLATFVRAR